MAKATASYSDDEFVAAIRRGDDRALAQLYRLHFPMISHYVLQNSGTEDEAKDVYQEGCATALWSLAARSRPTSMPVGLKNLVWKTPFILDRYER